MLGGCKCVPLQCRTRYTEQSKKRIFLDVRETYESFSPEQREIIDVDIEGSRDDIAETPEFVSEKLGQLDEQLELISDDKKIAYTKAMAMESRGGKEYIRSQNFRLMFLRADEFNAQLAANRVAKYFEDKLELFGAEKLASKIKQADLSDIDKEVFSSGCFCSTGATDIYGRLIVYKRRKLMDDFPVDSIGRSVFYLFHVLEDHVEWQRKGIVLVSDSRVLSSLKPSLEHRLFPVWRLLGQALPLRFAGVHVCYNNKMAHFFIRLALVVTPTNIGARFLTHYERTSQEIFACLLPYGIKPKDDLPLTDDWVFQRKMVDKFLDTLRQKEDSEEISPEGAD